MNKYWPNSISKNYYLIDPSRGTASCMDNKEKRMLFELGRQIGLKQAELLMKGTKLEVVCGDDEIILEKIPKDGKNYMKIILDGIDRYAKVKKFVFGI